MLQMFIILSDKNCSFYRGYLGPGGLHDDSNYTNCTGGAARVIDAAIFGNSHLYQRPTCKVSDFKTFGMHLEV